MNTISANPTVGFKDSHYVGEANEKGPYEEGTIVDTTDAPRPPLLTRMGLTADSFRRRTLADKHNQLNKTLKSRHLNMIAIGGSIGTGLFVGSGAALSNGGPAALVICFSIIGFMIFNTVYALGELACVYPVSGAFYIYAVRFIDPSWGFAMGWNYVMQWATVLPLEIIVAALTVEYWEAPVSVAVWVTIFFVAIVVLTIFGVLGYAEEEFITSGLKLVAIISFLIIGLVFVLGGGPESGQYSEYWGARYWYDPGAFANGFPGVCGVFVTAAFSFAGTELVGLAAAESEAPQKTLPSAVRQVFWRVTLFYILSLLFVGLLVPYDNPNLLGAGLVDVSASPFVIAAGLGGIPRYADFINVVIIFSVLSIGISGVFGGSRCLTALAETGYAPRIFTYIDRAGRPLPSSLVIILFGPIAYVGLAAEGETVLYWLLALSGLSALFTWGSICLSHIRFRAAWKYHGHTVDELPFQALFGVWGSWAGLLIIVIALIAQFYTAIKPAFEGLSAREAAESFFLSYLAMPVVIIFYIIGFAWKRKSWLKLSEMDVDSGRRELNWEAFEQIKAKKQQQSGWRRVLDRVF